jgi:hypothetical protein
VPLAGTSAGCYAEEDESRADLFFKVYLDAPRRPGNVRSDDAIQRALISAVVLAQ